MIVSLTPELQPATISIWEVAPPGAYFEFGLYQGANILHASKLEPKRECFGFDSFEGFPPMTDGEVRNHAHMPGHYRASFEEVQTNLTGSGVQLFKGWFSNEFFSSLPDLPAVAIAVVDCDLYISAVPVLKYLVPKLVPGAIILFDDWKMPAPCEREAWEETGADFEFMFDFGSYGHVVRFAKGASK